MKFSNILIVGSVIGATILSASALTVTDKHGTVSNVKASVETAVATTTTDAVTKTANLVATGKFTGLSKHVTSGGVSIINTGAGYIAVLENDFSLDGAPAPTLGFGKDGKFDDTTEFTKLLSISGTQVYSIPNTVHPENFNEFYVWCADFSVPLGVATLGTQN